MADGDTSTRPDEGQSPVVKQHHDNPYYAHIERGPYEIGGLLRCLSDRTYPPSLTDDDCQIADAVVRHADNGINTLLWGAEAIGALMVDLGEMEQYQMDASKVSALGDLIRHISVEVQFLHDTKMELQEEMCARDPKGGA